GERGVKHGHVDNDEEKRARNDRQNEPAVAGSHRCGLGLAAANGSLDISSDLYKYVRIEIKEVTMAGRPRTIDRDKVLDAAEAVVMRAGAAGLTIDAVAREAGITKGGVQYAFGSKENLIR